MALPHAQKRPLAAPELVFLVLVHPVPCCAKKEKGRPGGGSRQHGQALGFRRLALSVIEAQELSRAHLQRQRDVQQV